MPPSPLRDSLPEHAVLPGGASLATWPTLLIVDDDPQMLETLVWYFEKRRFHVAAAATLAEARNLFHRCRSWSLVISDYHLPDGTGLELCWWIRDQGTAAPAFLVMSGSTPCPAVGAGVAFLPKPFSLQALEQRVHALLGLPAACTGPGAALGA